MTDVLILHRIPGLAAGAIVPLDDRLRMHVEAGNAMLLPNESDGFGRIEVDAQEPQIHQLTGTMTDADLGYEVKDADADADADMGEDSDEDDDTDEGMDMGEDADEDTD